MKSILQLELGFSDAENYRRRENRELFNRIFIRNAFLDRLCEPSISFLVGEKGTGKTAYAVYLANNDYKETLGSLRYIRESEFQKFRVLKSERHLQLSDYVSIWKVILYLLMAEQLYEKEGGNELLRRFTQMGQVKAAIDEYYEKAFSPEIVQALQFVEQSKRAAEILAKHTSASAEQSKTLTFSESRFQTNLFYIQKRFEEALSQVRPSRNYILLIDGIDIRPASIPYDEYLECIKGLANAVWELNNDFFPGVKGGAGRLRVVMLVRPDIFETLGLQNQNTKIRDNSVFLNWHTEDNAHRTSEIFRVTDHLLAAQQGTLPALGQTWDFYFPWNAYGSNQGNSFPTSFIAFLRRSFFRPRDVLTMLSILQEIARDKREDAGHFSDTQFEDPVFKRKYADYLLGEIKDHLTFYYGSREYDLFLKFFEFLNGKRKFDYPEYEAAFSKFMEFVSSQGVPMPVFMGNAAKFLQFLYELNVLGYRETPGNDIPYWRWCYRERSYANISPKVKTGLTYEIFYGLSKALNVGQEFSHDRGRDRPNGGGGRRRRRRGRKKK